MLCLQELQEDVGSLLEFRDVVAAALPHIPATSGGGPGGGTTHPLSHPNLLQSSSYHHLHNHHHHPSAGMIPRQSAAINPISHPNSYPPLIDMSSGGNCATNRLYHQGVRNPGNKSNLIGSEGDTRISGASAGATSGGVGGGGGVISGGGVSDSGFTDKNWWSSSMGTKTSSNASSGPEDDGGGVSGVRGSTGAASCGGTTAGPSNAGAAGGSTEGGGLLNNQICFTTNTTTTTTISSSAGTNVTTTSASSSSVSIGHLEDELWQLLEIIEQKGTKLRLELNVAEHRAKLYGTEFDPGGNLVDNEEALSDPSNRIYTTCDTDAAADNVWPLSLPPYHHTPKLNSVHNDPLLRDQKFYPPGLSNPLLGRANQTPGDSPSRLSSNVVSSLISRASVAEREASEAQQRLADLHACLNLVLVEKRRLERELKWRTCGDRTLGYPTMAGYYGEMQDYGMPPFPSTSRQHHPAGTGVDPYGASCGYRHDSYPPTHPQPYPYYHPYAPPHFSPQHNPHSFPQAHPSDRRSNEATNKTLSPSKEPVILPRVLKIPIKDSKRLNPSDNEYRRHKSASGDRKRTSDYNAARTNSVDSDRRQLGDIEDNNKFDNNFRSGDARSYKIPSKNVHDIPGNDKANRGSESNISNTVNVKSKNSSDSTKPSSNTSALAPVARGRSRSVSMPKTSKNNKSSSVSSTLGKQYAFTSESSGSSNFAGSATMPLSTSVAISAASTTMGTFSPPLNTSNIKVLGSSLPVAGATVKVVGGRVSVTPNRERIAAILREKNVLELQRQLLHTVMEAEVS